MLCVPTPLEMWGNPCPQSGSDKIHVLSPEKEQKHCGESEYRSFSEYRSHMFFLAKKKTSDLHPLSLVKLELNSSRCKLPHKVSIIIFLGI